jgi:hypothetical protein
VRLIAIDPGKHSGLAVFEDGTLVEARSFDGDRPPYGRQCARLVVEVPSPGDQRAPVTDLLVLARRAGLAAGRVLVTGALEFVPARRWKGNVPKATMHDRILAALEGRERDLLGKDGNVLDAVGLGLYVLDRLDTPRVTR